MLVRRCNGTLPLEWYSSSSLFVSDTHTSYSIFSSDSIHQDICQFACRHWLYSAIRQTHGMVRPEEYLLRVRSPLSDIFRSLCRSTVSHAGCAAPACIHRCRGRSATTRIRGSSGYCAELVVQHVLCIGRNVGQCGGFIVVLGICQRSHDSGGGQKILYVHISDKRILCFLCKKNSYRSLS